jgi:hypothetical protein
MTVLLRRIGAGCPVPEFNSAAERVADKFVADRAADLSDVSRSLMLVLEYVGHVEAENELLKKTFSKLCTGQQVVEDGGRGSGVKGPTVRKTAARKLPSKKPVPDKLEDTDSPPVVSTRRVSSRPPSAFLDGRVQVESEAAVLAQDHVHRLRDHLGVVDAKIISAPGGRRILVPRTGGW